MYRFASTTHTPPGATTMWSMLALLPGNPRSCSTATRPDAGPSSIAPSRSSPSAPRYQLAVLARSGVSRTAMPPSGPHHSRVRCSSRARLRSYSRRAEPPARPRSEGSKVTSRGAVVGGRSTPRTVRGGPLVHGARAGRQVEPAEPARPGVAERHDLGARPLHCCRVSALPHTMVNQPTPAPVRARACTVISEILVPLWTQTLRHARGAREPPPRPPPHLPTASPVARAASSTEPRFVTSVNPAARMSSTAAPARFPERQYTR